MIREGLTNGKLVLGNHKTGIKPSIYHRNEITCLLLLKHILIEHDICCSLSRTMMDVKIIQSSDNKLSNIIHTLHTDSPHAYQLRGALENCNVLLGALRWNINIFIQQVNTFRPRHNGRHFAADIFKSISFNKTDMFLLKCHWNLYRTTLSNNLALVYMFVWIWINANVRHSPLISIYIYIYMCVCVCVKYQAIIFMRFVAC